MCPFRGRSKPGLSIKLPGDPRRSLRCQGKRGNAAHAGSRIGGRPDGPTQQRVPQLLAVEAAPPKHGNVRLSIDLSDPDAWQASPRGGLAGRVATGFGRPSAADRARQRQVGSVGGTASNDPLVGLAGEPRKEFEVGVVVKHREISGRRNRGDETIDERERSMLTSFGEQLLELQGVSVVPVDDRNRLEGVQPADERVMVARLRAPCVGYRRTLRCA